MLCTMDAKVYVYISHKTFLKKSRILLNLQTYKMKLVKDRIRNLHFLANVHDLVRFF